MNPALFLKFVEGIQALISAYPMVKEMVIQVKNLIATMFLHGLLTKQQQDTLYNFVDGTVAAHMAGTPPPHWEIQADPTDDPS